MTTQLRLLETHDTVWKLDERTKEIGRRGLARARAALRPEGSPASGGPTADEQATAA
jgi:hypothetical protein